MTRPVGSAISFGNTVGTICHDNPYLSLSRKSAQAPTPAEQLVVRWTWHARPRREKTVGSLA